jgi:serine/threonine protein kinase
MHTTAERDPLDLVAEEFADRCRRGEVPSITQYADKYPALADELRELLPAVAQMEMLKRYKHSSSLPTVHPAQDAPTKLGDYRIVRELGRGGMGVVYEAVQETLGRRVALKLLPLPGRNDAVRRERFLREAQVAAKLHHTNIVPVFGVGEEDGVPYFVMQFIPGCGLNDVIANWRTRDTSDVGPASKALVNPNQWRRIAGIGRAAANALQYAHEQGVLHRDVKPGNLLLDHHGTVWVADFGLAKLTDGESLTATGDLLGTIAYMAPEALRGVADARTDVYGLGMTLYELVTGKMPFDDSNPAVLIRKISDNDPPPPRQLNPGVPRDLETIILKAIAREPDRRYATAQELEDDLDAFLHDEPIRARRSSVFQRAWLWAKRNPILAALSAVTAAALVFAAAVGWVSYTRTRDALANEQKLLKDAKEANQKLSDNLALSLAAFEAVFEAAGGGPDPFGPMMVQFPRGMDRPPGGPREGEPKPPDGSRRNDTKPPDGDGRPRPGDEGPRMRPGGLNLQQPANDTSAMLEAVLTFYEKFAEQNATNPKLQLDAAKAYRKVGQLNFFLRRPEKAEAAVRRSVEMLDGLILKFPDSPDVSREYAMSVAAMAPFWAQNPSLLNERYATYRRAVELADPGPPMNPMVYRVLASMADRANEPAVAEQARKRAAEFQLPRGPGWPDGPPGDRERERRPGGDRGERRQ